MSTVLYSHYIFTAALLALGLIILYLPAGCMIYKTQKISPLRQAGWIALIAVCAMIAYITLGFSQPNAESGVRVLNVIPCDWINDLKKCGVGWVAFQLGANALMFMPVGFLLPAVFTQMRSAGRTMGAVMALSVLIEGTQYFIGRCADIDDAAMYLLGAGIGYFTYTVFEKAFASHQWWGIAIGRIALTHQPQKNIRRNLPGSTIKSGSN